MSTKGMPRPARRMQTWTRVPTCCTLPVAGIDIRSQTDARGTFSPCVPALHVLVCALRFSLIPAYHAVGLGNWFSVTGCNWFKLFFLPKLASTNFGL